MLTGPEIEIIEAALVASQRTNATLRAFLQGGFNQGIRIDRIDDACAQQGLIFPRPPGG